LHTQIRNKYKKLGEILKLKGLFQKFRKLEYKEGDKLTFTNPIKHVLKTTPKLRKHTKLKKIIIVKLLNIVQKKTTETLFI